jgi:hypothetical protein
MMEPGYEETWERDVNWHHYLTGIHQTPVFPEAGVHS